MIFLDSNIFLRYLTEPTSSKGQVLLSIATELISSIERGHEEATTSEVVLHEVCYVLGSKKHYGLPADTIAAFLSPILRLTNLRLPRGEKSIYLRALEIFSENPKLEFSDSVIAARCERQDIQLATFDEALGSLPILKRWQPETE